MKNNFKWFFNISYPYFYLFFGNLFLYTSLGNGLILENEAQSGGLESTDGVIKFSDQFLFEFLVLLAITTMLFYVIVVKFRKSGLKSLFGISLSFIYLTSITEILYLAFDDETKSIAKKYNLLITASLLFILGIRFMYIFLLSKYDVSTRNLGLLVAGLLAGRMIALYLDLISLIAISIVLIVYDIWNVFRGPLTRLIGKPTRINQNSVEQDLNFQKAIIEQVCDEGTPVFISRRNYILTGLGDLFFFAALLYRSLMIWGFVGILGTFVMLILGLLLTFKLLTYISPLPGLPIPVSLALLSYLLLWIIM